jgi:hypothetical protein
MEAKKAKENENASTVDMTATLESIKERKLEKVRLQTLLEPQGMQNFDTLYP